MRAGPAAPPTTARWAVPPRLRALLTGVLLGGTLIGCGPTEHDLLVSEADLATIRQGKSVSNGLSTNALVSNGLSTNGLSTNGLSTNGLSTNGLNALSFVDWFNADPKLHDMVMAYVVHCAAAYGTELSWTNPVQGNSYKWKGGLGLAPDWAAGNPATLEEQQVITACLAAHVNKYGVKVPISVLGKDAKGKDIPIESGELTTYSLTEACFFGNLFKGEGIYVGNDDNKTDSTESTARACALNTALTGPSTECPPLEYVGSCSHSCNKEKGNSAYSVCSAKGVTYRAITTRIRPDEKYKCGDGTCQFTERCGTGKTWDNCGVDCGPCKK